MDFKLSFIANSSGRLYQSRYAELDVLKLLMGQELNSLVSVDV